MAEEAKLLSVLSEFARTLLADTPIQATLDRLVVRIVEVLPVEAAGVTLITDDAGPAHIAASDAAALQFERLQSELAEGPCIAAFDSGAAVAVPDLHSGGAAFPRFARAAVDAGLRSVFTFPMRHGDHRIGALDLYRSTVGTLDEGDSEVAQTLADVATAYLLNARLRDEEQAKLDRFQHLALHDTLTGLPNRRLFEERLTNAASRAQRDHTIAAVFFADLDRFKEVNDTHGHTVGDDLLRAVAQRFTDLVRPGDTCARLSGDEFAFLCEDLHDRSDLDVIIGRITRAFDIPFVLPTAVVSITVSIGVAFAGLGEQVSAAMLAQADGAMYEAKREGGARHHIVDLRGQILLSPDTPV